MRWTDLATWRGTRHHGGRLDTVRGVVVHIAEGYFDGTIAWQQGDNGVSSHFIVGRDGRTAQMVETSHQAWTQRAGNGWGLTVECEGFTKGHRFHRTGWESLSDQQLQAVARILHKAHRVYGVPLKVTTSPNSWGLGHHSMGGLSWGHQACPGAPIIRQKPEIVRRALILAGSPAPSPAPGGPALDWTEQLVMALPILKRGNRGVPVKRLQALVNVAGGRLVVDGAFGPATEAAVKTEQRQAGIGVDGIVGRRTWSALLGE